MGAVMKRTGPRKYDTVHCTVLINKKYEIYRATLSGFARWSLKFHEKFYYSSLDMLSASFHVVS